MTFDITIMIKTFYKSNRMYGENFVSIQQAVAEKNTKVLCRQRNKDRETDRQSNGPKRNTHSFGEGKNLIILAAFYIS